MPKTFYTERDIEDLSKRGVISLQVDDDVVLTDLARDKAKRLGIELVRPGDEPPSAPERPYISDQPSPSAEVMQPKPRGTLESPIREKGETVDELHARVRKAVLARLGDSVDENLLDTIIQRVLQNIRSS